MKCETFMEYLDGYLDGSLSELERQTMQEHLEACPACKKIYEEQKQLLDALASLDDGVRAPENLIKDTMQRIHSQRNPARRRRSYWIGGGIAAALCVMVGVSTLISGLGMGSTAGAPDTPMTMGVTADGAWGGEAGAVAEDAVMENEAMLEEPSAPAPEEAPAADAGKNGLMSAATTDSQADGASERAVQAPEYGLKIIREASIELQTENYEEDLQALEELVESCGGYITSREEYGSEQAVTYYDGRTRNSSLTIRVPSDQLDAFVEQAKAVGIVTSSGITETDVTDQYADTDRRLQAYQKQYDRVLEMMDQATTVEELIQIESELSRLEMQIEDCQGSLNYWDARVNYSTVHVYVDEVKRAVPANPTLSERMRNALATSWENFKEGWVDALVNLYGGIPYIITWVIVLGVGAVIVVLVVRTVRKRRDNR